MTKSPVPEVAGAGEFFCFCVQISDVTDKILPRIEDWQNRPLDEVYPILYIDAIHYSVRDNGVIRKLAAYSNSLTNVP